jgi:hypothetical protein
MPFNANMYPVSEWWCRVEVSSICEVSGILTDSGEWPLQIEVGGKCSV